MPTDKSIFAAVHVKGDAELIRKLRHIKKTSVRATIGKKALTAAAKPMREDLKRRFPKKNIKKQISGNTKKAVTSVVRKYPHQGNAAAIIGVNSGWMSLPEGIIRYKRNKGGRMKSSRPVWTFHLIVDGFNHYRAGRIRGNKALTKMMRATRGKSLRNFRKVFDEEFSKQYRKQK